MANLSRRELLGWFGGASLLSIAQPLAALQKTGAEQNPEPPLPQLTRAEKTEFLKSANVKSHRGAPRGVTDTLRVTLTNGTLTHDASFQCVDISKPTFQTDRGTEMNFRDCWKFNMAAYRLDEILGLNMIPVTVERKYNGSEGCMTWWVDDVLGTDLELTKKKLTAPSQPDWTAQRQIVRVFDQLIYNTDRNLGNLVIDKDWRIWMIDHTRAFRARHDLPEPKILTRCDRELLKAMKALDTGNLKPLSKYVLSAEITGLLKRRDRIVALLEACGPAALYNSPRRPA